MRLRISARNVEIPASLKEYVAQEMEGLTKYFDHILDAHVTIAQEKHRHTVDVHLNVNGKSYQAEGVGDNPKVPVDEAVGKLRRQLKRHKSKQRRQSLRGEEVVLRGKAVEVTGVAPAMPELPTTDEVPRRLRASRVVGGGRAPRAGGAKRRRR
jgi:putative sigma-54 modulation protein